MLISIPGSGPHIKAWRDRQAVLIERAGLHSFFKISKQMAPVWLEIFGCHIFVSNFILELHLMLLPKGFFLVNAAHFSMFYLWWFIGILGRELNVYLKNSIFITCVLLKISYWLILSRIFRKKLRSILLPIQTFSVLYKIKKIKIPTGPGMNAFQ
jgi:hypothetical protein